MDDRDAILEEGEFEGRELERLSFIDPLTGLFNRRYLYRFLPKAIEKAKTSGKALAVFMIDVDDLKRINDTYGHLCTDNVLKEIAEILRKGVRQGDLVGRYAGDEFVILLQGVTSSIALTLAQRIVDKISNYTFKGKEEGSDIHTTVSVGFAVCPDDSDEPEELIDQADRALYLSKQRGKNNVSQVTEVALETTSRMKALESFPCPEFIGRKEELFQLQELLKKISVDSTLQLAFISGGAGMGKSRLLREFEQYAESQGATLISGKCHEKEKLQPYWLLAQSLGTFLEQWGLESARTLGLISKIPSAELRELTEVVPQLKKIVGESSGRNIEGEEEKRFRIFKGFRDFLLELGKESIVVFSFDDISWADEATMHFVHYLARQEKRSRIMICGTFRRSELAGTSPLGNVWSDLSDQDNFHEIMLKPLSEGEVSEMIGAIFSGMNVSSPFIHMVCETTKGNPFFIEEVLKSLIESEFIFYKDQGWQMKDIRQLDIPASLEEVIGRRLRSLDNETKEMIIQAAVVGEDFDLGVLHKMEGKNEGYILELIDRARRMRLINEAEKEGGDKFSFIHKQIQDVLYKNIDETQKRTLHHKVGEIVERAHHQDIAVAVGELNYHFDRSGDEARSAEYAKILSERISQVFDRREILTYLDRLSEEMVMEVPEIEVEIPDTHVGAVVKFIRLIHSSIINILLYPPTSKMRKESVAGAYASLKAVLKEVEKLNVGEAGGVLLINGKRLSGSEFKKANLESFITLMVDHNIGTISFGKGVEERELHVLLMGLSQKPEDLVSSGGLRGMLKNENVIHIKVDEARYTRVGGLGKEERKEKEKLKDMMLMEFLLGKVSPTGQEKEILISKLEKEPKELAEAMTQVVKSAPPTKGEENTIAQQAQTITDGIQKMGNQLLGPGPSGWRRYKENLAQAFLALEPELRSHVFRNKPFKKPEEPDDVVGGVLEALSDQTITDLVVSEYERNKESLLPLKEFMERLLSVEPERKERLIPELKKKFLEAGMKEEELDFITGERPWEKMSSSEKLAYVLQLPGQVYCTAAMRKNIETLIRELTFQGQKDEAGKLAEKLLKEMCTGPTEVREGLLGMMSDLVNVLNSGGEKFGPISKNVVATFIDRIHKEDDSKVFSRMLRECEKVAALLAQNGGVDQLTLLGELIRSLRERLNAQDPLARAQGGSIRDSLFGLSTPQVITALLSTSKPSFKNGGRQIGDMVVELGDYAIDSLIDVGIRRQASRGDSFEGYLWREKVAGLLKKMGPHVYEAMEKKVSEATSEELKYMVEMIGHMETEDLVGLLKPLLQHRDVAVRKEVIIALGKIGTEAAVKLLAGMLKDRDWTIRRLAAAKLKRLKR